MHRRMLQMERKKEGCLPCPTPSSTWFSMLCRPILLQTPDNVNCMSRLGTSAWRKGMCKYSLPSRNSAPPPAHFREQTTQQHPIARVQAGSPACIFTYAWVGHEVQVRVFGCQRDCVCDVVNAVSEHNCRLVGGSGGQVGRVLDGSNWCYDGTIVRIITSGVADVHSRCFNVPGTSGTSTPIHQYSTFFVRTH